MEGEPVLNSGSGRDGEQEGMGLRDLHEQFKAATTAATCRRIADEARARSTRPGLPAPIETSYQILAQLAERRALALILGSMSPALAEHTRDEG